MAMLRRPSCSLFSFSLRSVGSARTFHSRIATVPTFNAEISRECSVPSRRFSTATPVKPAADDSVVEFLEFEIKAAQESIQNDYLGKVADEFPFEIVDNAGEQTIMLRREFDGEIIKVAVDTPNVSPIEDNNDDDDEEEEEEEDTGIPMVVSVSKGNGKELEFGLTAFSDEICIDSDQATRGLGRRVETGCLMKGLILVTWIRASRRPCRNIWRFEGSN